MTKVTNNVNQVEQQLKLYVESVQSKLDEQEKDGDNTMKNLEALKGLEVF